MLKNKYKFTKKYDFWEIDHHTNFSFVKSYYGNSDYFEKNCTVINHLKFLEIGVFEAKTSVWLLNNVLNIKPINGRDGYLYCIDPIQTKNCKFNLGYHIGNVIFYEEFSFDVLIRLLSEKELYRFDFIYVDGDHNACNLLQDLVLSWRLLKINGIMLIDDYEMETRDPWFYISHPEFLDNPRLRFTHPRIAIDAFMNIYRGQYEIVIDNYQIGLKKVAELG